MALAFALPLMALQLSSATATALAPPTVRVSVASDGSQSNGYASLPSISSDGNTVLFKSTGGDLVPGFTSTEPHLYVRDLLNDRTVAVSVSSEGEAANGVNGADYDINGDGMAVTFVTDASNLADNETEQCMGTYWPEYGEPREVPANCRDIFLHRRADGTTEKLSVTPSGGEAIGNSANPQISDDGNHVAFLSEASNLVEGDTDQNWDVFLRDLTGSGTTTLLTPGDALVSAPAMSADGQTVAYAAYSPTSDPSLAEGANILVYDVVTGITSPLPLHPLDGSAHYSEPTLSGDGNKVTFLSQSRLTEDDTNNGYDVYVYDRSTGSTRIVSRNADGTQLVYADRGQVTDDGKFVLFRGAGGLVPGTAVDKANVYVRDLSTWEIRVANVGSNGAISNEGADTGFRSISADGSRVAFWSRAANLVEGDTNGIDDVFVHDMIARAPGDSTAPTVTITSPKDNAYLTNGETVTAQWGCTDASTVSVCSGTLNGAAIANGARLDNMKAGTYTLRVVGEDEHGNSASSEVVFEVLAPGDVNTPISGGETVSSGTASTSTPVVVSIVVPEGIPADSTLTVDTQDAGASPTGYQLFGQELVIHGPAATDEPYEMTFTVDSSALDGVAPADVQVFRDGAALLNCGDPAVGAADACVVSRADQNGDAVISVRTFAFSAWTLGRLDYELSGPLAPVAAAPTVNTAKAGSAIPVKFKLGGNRGLDVLRAGSPTSTAFKCSKGAKTNAVQGAGTGSSLTYDAASQTYTYTWKTSIEMKGCRDLVLSFRDGTSLRTLYNLK